MIKGTVKWFNMNKGYGFINRENSNKDVFVHINDLQQSGIENLEENQSVSFETATVRGKEKAVNIKII